ncbi:hypothetical protein GALL_256480 [mine drainage metagenome]|uniref:Uncharacterized protein n=1 Tax=mine drainage metagenome TaxID=410659 RepID=A0A1J5RSG2_9ZZZZ
MNTLPLSAFPIAANATKSSGFAFAVLIGLALFMAQQNKSKANQNG